jgi:rRNA-processing protein EBP2
MAKKKKSKTSSNDKNVDTKERIVTMQALQEQSDDDNDDNGLPPESEWNADAKALKARIDEGQFDQLVLKLENKKQNKKDDEEESSIEEVDLEDEDSASSAEESRENEEMAEPHEHEAESEDEIEKDSDMEKEDVAFDNEEEEQDDEGAQDAEEESGNEGNDSADEIENEVDDDDESENETSGDDKNTHHAKNKENRSKALHIVTEMLVAEKKKWPWAETFDVVVETPLPFGTGENDVNIHDDLKRELAFYDMALEAVHVAKRKCKEANIPFTRPDDFFAEMVKTDGTLFIYHRKKYRTEVYSFTHSNSFVYRSHGQGQGSLDL